MSVWVCEHECRRPWRPEKRALELGLQTVVSCPDLGFGNQKQDPWESSSALNYTSISPTLTMALDMDSIQGF